MLTVPVNAAMLPKVISVLGALWAYYGSATKLITDVHMARTHYQAVIKRRRFLEVREAMTADPALESALTCLYATGDIDQGTLERQHRGILREVELRVWNSPHAGANGNFSPSLNAYPAILQKAFNRLITAINDARIV